jgi:hypothetical protein
VTSIDLRNAARRRAAHVILRGAGEKPQRHTQDQEHHEPDEYGVRVGNQRVYTGSAARMAMRQQKRAAFIGRHRVAESRAESQKLAGPELVRIAFRSEPDPSIKGLNRNGTRCLVLGNPAARLHDDHGDA